MKFSLALLSLTLAAFAQDDGFVSLFNGKDLNGWINVNCAPGTWGVKDGMITCTGKPTGAMRTLRQYENFIFECEWRHLTSGGNAGVFIWSSPISAPGVPFLRAVEVQVLDHGYGNTANYTTHGDVFPIHGTTMKPFGRSRGMRSFPSEERSKPSPEWNHYRIEARDGVLRLSVNGKEVSGGEECVWRKGYLALESEGAPVEWKNLRVKELPSSGAKPEESAPEAQGHQALYNGLDLKGWKTTQPDRWQPSDWKLVLKEGPAGPPLLTESEFGDCEVIVDVRLAKDAAADAPKPALLIRGTPVALPATTKWMRHVITVQAGSATIQSGDTRTALKLPENVRARDSIGLADCGLAVEFASIYVRPLP
jgi:hypothetical protein